MPNKKAKDDIVIILRKSIVPFPQSIVKSPKFLTFMQEHIYEDSKDHRVGYVSGWSVLNPDEILQLNQKYNIVCVFLNSENDKGFYLLLKEELQEYLRRIRKAAAAESSFGSWSIANDYVKELEPDFPNENNEFVDFI